MKNDIMPASEAAKRAKSVESEVHAKQLALIKIAIDKAVTEGKLSTSIYFYPSEPVKLRLQSLGYTVSSANFRNETTTEIHWNPTEIFTNGGYR